MLYGAEVSIQPIYFGSVNEDRVLGYVALGYQVDDRLVHQLSQVADSEVAFFQAGGMVFGLWCALGGHGAPGIELAHNVRSPREVDALLADAERAGAAIVRQAARADWGGYTGAFADPDGYVWEIAHNPDWKLAGDGTVHLP